MFPTDWPLVQDATDGSASVRVRVTVMGKGVARGGAALWADDLPANEMSPAADDLVSEPPEAESADTAMLDTAAPTENAKALSTACAVVEATAVGRVTSEMPRGAARGATASALCSAAALQHLR